MMHEAYDHLITFEHSLPELTRVIEELTTLTETSIEYTGADRYVSCDGDGCWMYFMPEDRTVCLTGPKRYILSALLLVLIEMGGCYTRHIPHYAKWPWLRVKDKLAALPPYDEVPIWLEYQIMGIG